ncbi:MAG: hypothetical protein H6925_04745 [Holosporaceae bacterium]|nr:MAG: hypothetical protein H6925_04745 [Holosporaceae bacterium]
MQTRLRLDAPSHTQTIASPKKAAMINMKKLSCTAHVNADIPPHDETNYHLGMHGFHLASGHGALSEEQPKTPALFAPQNFTLMAHRSINPTLPMPAPSTKHPQSRHVKNARFNSVMIDPNHPLPHIALAR